LEFLELAKNSLSMFINPKISSHYNFLRVLYLLWCLCGLLAASWFCTWCFSPFFSPTCRCYSEIYYTN